jgi:hypothetical protein
MKWKRFTPTAISTDSGKHKTEAKQWLCDKQSLIIDSR